MDQELIDGIIRGDRFAIQNLVSTYQRKVIKTAYYFLGNMEDAEDLSQEVFMEIIKSIGMFKKSSSLSTWIYRITVNKSLNHLKKSKRKGIMYRIETIFHPSNSKVASSLAGLSVTDSTFEENEKRQILHHAIHKLPENQRIAFILHKYEDRSYHEVSDIMNLTLSSVESLIHRAKMNLQKRLITEFPEYLKS